MAKILIVEDDAMLCSILQQTFSNAHYEVHTAADGFAAELEIKSWHPDLVLLDLLLPNEDGFGVLRKIRADSETFRTHVVVLSNLSAEDVVEQVKKFGVTEYFVKANTTPKEMLGKVQEMLPA